MNIFIQQLQQKGMSNFKVTEFPEEIFTSDGVAKTLGIRLSQVAKAMVVKVSDGTYALALLPGDKRLNTKKFSQQLNGKKIDLARREETERVTGLPIGAITPLVAFGKPEIKVIIDSGLLSETEVNISAGDLRVGLNLNPGELANAISARVADIAE